MTSDFAPEVLKIPKNKHCDDQYRVLWGDQYSVLFYLLARGRHFCATRATR